MKPAVFSEHRYHKRAIGWVREGTKIKYSDNEKFSKDQNSANGYFQLSFEYKFTYEGDVVYFSHAIPYTVSDLTEFIDGHIKDRNNSKFIRFKSLGRTLGSQELDIL